MAKTAWVAGASGLIGGHLVSLLSQHNAYDRVVAFVRTPSTASWARLPKVEQFAVDYQQLHAPSGGVDDVFCALGSTTRKTPDKAAYYKIDVSYPLQIAQLGLKHKAEYYGLVSAHGAKVSSLSFYLQMKGELEQELGKLNYKHMAFARPSLLLGEREEFRPAEKLGDYFMRLLPGNLKAIQAHDVAAALILEANSGQIGCEILPSGAMQKSQRRLAE